MQSKYLYMIGAFLFLAAMALYFYLHPSYRLSFEAKIYYTIGDYDSAYEVASKAYAMNEYNTMAFTIKVQSENANRYRDFIKLAREYYAKIEEISQKKDIQKSDKLRIKMLSEVVLQSYKRLNPTRLTDKILVKDAKRYYESFQKLYDNLFDESLKLDNNAT